MKAIEKAGGEHREYAAPKPWQMPKWAAERAREEGLHLDQEAAKALVAAVGTRQQRLAREVERLAILAHPRTQLSADEVTRLAAGEAPQQVYDLADALVAGDIRGEPRRSPSGSRAARTAPSKLVYPIVRRLRDVHRAAELLDAGVPEGKVASRDEDAAVGRQAHARPGEARPTARRSPAPYARSPTSRSSCAAAAPASTRTRPSR